MNNILKIENISQLTEMMGMEKAKHPLICVVDFSMIQNESSRNYGTLTSGFYSIMLKNRCKARLKYGREYYDFQEGTMVFMAPEQVMTFEDAPDADNDINGWGLFFHPDLLRSTHLSEQMKHYSFFSYDTHEALHLSDKEKGIVNNCVSNIETELNENIDQHSQMVIVSNLELLLNYCTRFYDRQFITRKSQNKDLLSRFEKVVTSSINADKTNGIPSVKQCAEEMNLSANYLSDLLKKETGKNAQEHIHYYLIEAAKNRLLISTDSISQIAYDLGFEYPQYFSKMFKKKTGMTPNEYRSVN